MMTSQRSSVVAVLVLCGMLCCSSVGIVQAQSEYVNIPLDGSNVTGHVVFMGEPWVGTFTPTTYGAITVPPYIIGDPADTIVRLYIGLDYKPNGQQYDWTGHAVGTGTYEFWYAAHVNVVFPGVTYYVSVIDDIINPATFTFNVMFEPVSAPNIIDLQIGAQPYPGKVNRAQYDYYTVTPKKDGNLNCTVQFYEGGGALVVNPGSYATLGNNQWMVKAPKPGSYSLTAMYVQAGQTYYLSVWGESGVNQGSDDDYDAIDKYYVSVTYE